MWNIKFQEQPLVHQHMHAFLWIGEKINFWKLINLRLYSGFDIQTEYSSFRFRFRRGRKSLQIFLEDFKNFHSYSKFSHESSEQSVTFLNIKANLIDTSITTDFSWNPRTRVSICIFSYSRSHKKSYILWTCFEDSRDIYISE